jgi:2-polyprenyl-6-methoxyphenol hydroxylase-like FAD-dependent oxidoreductase
MAASDIKYTDVLVCGAGPVGLLIALGLAQQGIDTAIIGLSPYFTRPKQTCKAC